MRKVVMAALALLVFWQSAATAQVKDCEVLKAEIAAKLDAKGVRNYTLEIVDPSAVGDATVVGSCAGGTKRITYKRN